MQIHKIDESMEEESPEALPHHNMPPQSMIDARSSVIHSESNFDSYSHDDRHFKFSADPKKPISRLQETGEQVVVLRESKQDKLTDYLNSKFRPPSENRSESRRSGSRRSSKYSAGRGSSTLAKNKLGPMISFGASDSKEKDSQGIFRYTETSPKNKENRDTYSFLDPESRARNVMNSLEKNPIEDTDLKNRVSFGQEMEDEEYKVNSKSVFSYSDDLNESNKFGMGGNKANIKSQKYMDNVKMSQSKYLDVQDVIRQNNRNSDKL